MGRHRRTVDLRSDRLATALDPILGHPQVDAVLLVDVGSGMVLDGDAAPGRGADQELLGGRPAALVPAGRGRAPPGAAAPGRGADLELLGVRHAEIVRAERDRDAARRVVVVAAGGTRELLRVIPDPHGDDLLLSVVVRCSRWRAGRLRRLLRAVPADVVTAGPLPASDGPVPHGPVPDGPVADGPVPDAPTAGGHRPPPVLSAIPVSPRTGPDGRAAPAGVRGPGTTPRPPAPPAALPRYGGRA